jgi:hypothetical protein
MHRYGNSTPRKSSTGDVGIEVAFDKFSDIKFSRCCMDTSGSQVMVLWQQNVRTSSSAGISLDVLLFIYK